MSSLQQYCYWMTASSLDYSTKLSMKEDGRCLKKSCPDDLILYEQVVDQWTKVGK